ncbi:MAG: methyltransferase domain-containing protein [Cyanobacteriota bacterium]|nr:methyltransferase domain-containing protein [Cyanobacteriota bacterium]
MMPVAGLAVVVPLAAAVGLLAWWWRPRRYTDASSVAAAYDRWTDDRLLESLWGEHIHLGHYGDPPKRADFRAAKATFVHALVRWSGLDRLPPGSKVLDVGCGIGGSARILAREYGFDVLGITISPAQVERARQLTPPDLACHFAVMDALDLHLPADNFDAVWSVEASPHMPDKQRYVDELLRVLRPGGRLAVGDWNRRDPADGPMTPLEAWVMRQLLVQWAHPEFASIKGLKRHLQSSPHGAPGLQVDTADWSQATLPSWIDSILEGVRRPQVFLHHGPRSLLQGLREIPTILLMHWAFSTGLMAFGVFRACKPVGKPQES